MRKPQARRRAVAWTSSSPTGLEHETGDSLLRRSSAGRAGGLAGPFTLAESPPKHRRGNPKGAAGGRPLGDRDAEIGGARRAAHVRGAWSVLRGRLDRREDCVVRTVQAEMGEHHRATPD